MTDKSPKDPKDIYKKFLMRMVPIVFGAALFLWLIIQILCKLLIRGKFPDIKELLSPSVLWGILIGALLLALEAYLLNIYSKARLKKFDVLKEQISKDQKIIGAGVTTTLSKSYSIFLMEQYMILFDVSKLNIAAKNDDFEAHLIKIPFSDIIEAYEADSKMIIKTEQRKFSVTTDDINTWIEYLSPILDEQQK